MPRLIFQGDIVNSLGDKFPTAYISNISVFDSQIKVQFNCFVEDVALPEMIGDLKLYAVPVYNDSDYQKIISDPNNLISRIYEARDSNQPYFRGTTGPSRSDASTGSPRAAGGTSPTNYFQQFLIDKFEVIETRNYNANNNQYLKLVFEKNITGFSQLLGNLNYVSFVVFTSFLTPEEIEQKAIRLDFDSFTLDQISKISHTKTVEGRMVINESFNSFILNGQDYHGKVIQDLTGVYRVNNEQELQSLIRQTRVLNAQFSDSEDQQLQSFVDSCSFIIETQSNMVDFLRQLKTLLDSFPRRTSVSALGIYYNRLKAIVFAFNDFLSTQSSLEKKIINSVHNFDFRNASLTFLPDQREPFDSLHRYRNSLRPAYNHQFIYNPYMDRTRRFNRDSGYTAPGSPTKPDEICYNHLFFLFDYEKALHKTSNISEIFNVDEIIMYFGENCLSPYFQFHKVSYERLHYVHINTPEVAGCRLTGLFNNVDYNLDSVDESVPLNVQQTTNFQGYVIPQTSPQPASLQTLDVRNETGGAFSAYENITSLIAQRSFDTLQTIGDYKLACFEINDIQTKFDIKTAYKLKVEIKDYTAHFIVRRIIRPAMRALEGLSVYYDLASDFCSYNDLDGRFNDFFIDYVEERFGSMPKMPWELAPIWYHILKNLLTKEAIESASETLYDNIQNEIIKISPQTGNLENIETFLQMFKGMMSNFEEGGLIYEKIYGGTRADGTPSGNGFIDDIDTVYVRTFEDLPAILDKNLSTYQTEYECFDNVEKFNRSKEISVYNGKNTLTFKRMLRLVDRNIKDLFGFNIEQEQATGSGTARGNRGTGASGTVSADTGTRTLSSALGNAAYDEKTNYALAYFFWLGGQLFDNNSFVADMKRQCLSYLDSPNSSSRTVNRKPIPEVFVQTLFSDRKDDLEALLPMVINTMQYIRQINKFSGIDSLSNKSVIISIMSSIVGGTIDDEKLSQLAGLCSDATEGTFLEILEGIRLGPYNEGAARLRIEFVNFAFGREYEPFAEGLRVGGEAGNAGEGPQPV
jgi:hypothetical protein